MPFYSFPQITERDSSIAVRAMRTSFVEKIADTFYIFSGSSMFFSLKGGFNVGMPDGEVLQFGLSDYPLFFLKLPMHGLYLLFDYFSNQRKDNRFGVILYTLISIFSLLLYSSLWLVHFSVNAVLTVISLPIVFAIHLIYKPKGDELKQALINNDQLNQANNYNYFKGTPWEEVHQFIKDFSPTPASWQENLELGVSTLAGPYRNWQKVVATRFVDLHDGKRAKLVFIMEGHYHYKYLLFSDTPAGRAGYEAFMQLNIANYDGFAREKPVIGAVVLMSKLSSTYRVLRQAYQQSDKGASKSFIANLPKEITNKILIEAVSEEAAQVNLDAKFLCKIGLEFGFDAVPEKCLSDEERLLISNK